MHIFSSLYFRETTLFFWILFDKVNVQSMRKNVRLKSLWSIFLFLNSCFRLLYYSTNKSISLIQQDLRVLFKTKLSLFYPMTLLLKIICVLSGKPITPFRDILESAKNVTYNNYVNLNIVFHVREVQTPKMSVSAP